MSGPKGVALTTLPAAAPAGGTLVAGLATGAAVVGGLVVAGVVIYVIAKQVQKARREYLRDELRSCAQQLVSLSQDANDVLGSLCQEDNAILESVLSQSQSRIATIRTDLGHRFHRMMTVQEEVAQKVEETRKLQNLIIPSDWPEEERGRVRNRVEALLASAPVIPSLDPDFSPDGIHKLCSAEKMRDDFLAALVGVRDVLQQESNDIHKRLIEQRINTSCTQPRKLSDLLAELPKQVSPEKKNPVPEKLERLMEKAVQLESSGCWVQLLERTAKIRQEPDLERQRLLYNDLVIHCSQQINLQKEHESWRREGMELLARARAFEEVSIEGIVSDLESILRAGAITDLEPSREKIADMEKQEEAIKLHKEKQRAICESLQALGYVVTDGEMHTALAENGKMIVKKSQESEYGIEVTTNRNVSVLETAMVRYADSGDMSDQQKMRDKSEEESWCQEHARFLKSLEKRGIQAGKKYQLAPGQHPVKIIVTSDKQASATSSKRPTAKRQEMR